MNPREYKLLAAVLSETGEGELNSDRQLSQKSAIASSSVKSRHRVRNKDEHIWRKQYRSVPKGLNPDIFARE